MSGGMPWTVEVHELSEGFTACVYDEHGMMIADYLTEERAHLIAAAPKMADMIAQNLATMGVTRMRLVEYGKPTSELDLAIEQTRTLLTKIGATQ